MNKSPWKISANSVKLAIKSINAEIDIRVAKVIVPQLIFSKIAREAKAGFIIDHFEYASIKFQLDKTIPPDTMYCLDSNGSILYIIKNGEYIYGKKS